MYVTCHCHNKREEQNAMTSNTDQTQELIDKINESITALCAETDAAKQNETYRAWLPHLEPFLFLLVQQLAFDLHAAT